MGLLGVLIIMIVVQAGPLIPRLSIKPLAEKFLRYTTAYGSKEVPGQMLNGIPSGIEVFNCTTYYQYLPLYLNRTVKILEWQGELAFGAEVEPDQKQIVSYNDFKEAWTMHPKVCVFARQDCYNDLIKHPWFTSNFSEFYDGHVLACNYLEETP
jgi:hypothetical protein